MKEIKSNLDFLRQQIFYRLDTTCIEIFLKRSKSKWRKCPSNIFPFIKFNQISFGLHSTCYDERWSQSYKIIVIFKKAKTL